MKHILLNLCVCVPLWTMSCTEILKLPDVEESLGFNVEKNTSNDVVVEWMDGLKFNPNHPQVKTVLSDTVRMNYIYDLCNEHDILMSVTLAQSILETGWWRHQSNNAYFGIKGKGQTLWTTEEIDGELVSQIHSFRQYDSWEDSFEDYAKTISYKYYSGETLDVAIDRITSVGYATDSNYGKKLENIIRKYQLEKLDV